MPLCHRPEPACITALPIIVDSGFTYKRYKISLQRPSDINRISEKYTIYLLIEHLNIPHTEPDHFFYTLKGRQYHQISISKAEGRPSTQQALDKPRQPIK